jgi:murein DD-endopeptidase MepM/ murein hydrolase activator NlpD
VRAAAAGRVIWAGPAGGYGLLVKIDHGGGMETRYAHLSRNVVGVGQHVAAGDVVGYVGTTGVATGPHLHFEVRQWGVPVDASGLWRQEVVA